MIWAQNSCRLSLETPGTPDQKTLSLQGLWRSCNDEVWPPDGATQATVLSRKRLVLCPVSESGRSAPSMFILPLQPRKWRAQGEETRRGHLAPPLCFPGIVTLVEQGLGTVAVAGFLQTSISRCAEKGESLLPGFLQGVCLDVRSNTGSRLPRLRDHC